MNDRERRSLLRLTRDGIIAEVRAKRARRREATLRARQTPDRRPTPAEVEASRRRWDDMTHEIE